MTVYHADSISSVQSEYIATDVTFIVAYGYAAVGDGGGALYVRSPSEPTHAGKVQSMDGSWWELRDDFPSLKQFGARDDGSTDSTSFFNALASYSNEKQVCAWVNPTRHGFCTNGNHRFDYGLSGRGNGWECQVIATHPTNNIVKSICGTGPSFTGVLYSSSVTRSGGITISIDAPPGTVSYKPKIADNVFAGGFVDISLNRATVAIVKDNFSIDFRGNFLAIQNVDFPDNGDHSITGNVWDTSMPTANSGIVQYNAGGARISDNKGGRGSFAYELFLTGNAAQSTSVLNIVNNSFENQIHGCIRLHRYPGSTAFFSKVIISSNELGAACDNPIIGLDDNSGFISEIVVNDNILQFNGIGIAAFSAKNLTIGGNNFRSFGGSSIGIQLDVGTSGVVDRNTFRDVTTPIANYSPNVAIS
jgi:hypothetical protein